MRNSRLLFFVVLALAVCARAGAQDVASASVSVNVNLAPRTSLKVSGRVLRFDVGQSGQVATAAVDFAAGARVPSGSGLVLTVEPLHGLEGPGGAADADATISFAGEGDGLLSGDVATSRATVVGRWQESGLREGRVIFTLRANAAGSYTLPVRFVLSTP